MTSSTDPSAGAERETLVLAVEREVSLLFSRVRSGNAAVAQDIHPQLSVSAYRILLRINDVGKVRITDLATHFAVGKPTMSRQVAALLDTGLVDREPDPDDGRGVLVSLTDAGQQAFVRLRVRRHRWIQSMLADFSNAEAQEFATLLQRFVAPQIQL